MSGAPAAASQRIVAFGDSFTAGFGFYDDGTEMTGEEFFTCVGEGTIPADKKNDLCSSNGTARTPEDPLVFAPDYGYANQISWAAQVAQGLGVPAITGGFSSGQPPADLPAGQGVTDPGSCPFPGGCASIPDRNGGSGDSLM